MAIIRPSSLLLAILAVSMVSARSYYDDKVRYSNKQQYGGSRPLTAYAGVSLDADGYSAVRNENYHFHGDGDGHGGNNGGYYTDRDTGNDFEFDISPSHVELRASEDVAVDCSIKGHHNFKVQWTKVGGPLGPRASHRMGRLLIHNAQPEDSGRYVCVAEITENDGTISTAEGYATVEVEEIGLPQEHKAGAVAFGRRCLDDEKRCSSSECVKVKFICDGERDCRDGSDELGCGYHQLQVGGECEPNEFRCNNRDCVQKMWVCDGEDDCGDNSDEQSCRPRGPGEICSQTEFKCQSQDQCIPRGFHCDGQNDCLDGSDEVGCRPPEEVEPPPPSKTVALGDTFELRCRAVGVPVPYINWRKNWGPVCEPPRCTQTSEDGLGILVVRETMEIDAGAYTCEAINVKGRKLVVPDCIVSIGGEPNPAPPPTNCNPVGTLRELPGGGCECKRNVMGPNCDHCVDDSFWFNEANPDGCISCFCSGIQPTTCKSSNWYRTQIRKSFNSGQVTDLSLSDKTQQEVQEARDLNFDLQSHRGFVTVRVDRGQTSYWRLEGQFLGDNIAAYGGNLVFKFRFKGDGRLSTEPLVILRGSHISLYYMDNKEYRSDTEYTVTVPLYYNQWWHEHKNHQTNREHLMMTLATLDSFMIRASHVDNMYESSLGEIIFDVAADRDTQQEQAWAVEQCTCPAAYVGLSCEHCAPGYERDGAGLWFGTCAKSSAECNRAGSIDPNPGPDGQCRCKDNVVGPYCDQCAPGSFFLDEQNPDGCVKCFCSGVSNKCGSSGLFRSQESIRGSQLSAVRMRGDTGGSDMFRPRSEPRISGNAIEMTDFSEVGEDGLYWELPDNFLGNKLSSYGGVLKITLKYSGYGSDSYKPLVVLKGNQITLEYRSPEPISPDREHTIEIWFFENKWGLDNTREATHEHMLMTLANLDTFLIRAHHKDQTSSSQLIEVVMDYGLDYDTNQEQALAVEKCDCNSDPRYPGHEGLSCETCKQGYTRTGGGIWLGLCQPCMDKCNQHSNDCDAETGVCRNCMHHTTGQFCEICEPGYEGDARRGTPRDCTLVSDTPKECRCHNHSPRGCDNNGRCILCEHNTEGYNCEKCKRGFYGDATQGTPYDCPACPCPGESDCYVNDDGSVVCTSCPAGYSGDRCTDCAPGYVRDDNDRTKCKPIGAHGSGHIDYTNRRPGGFRK